MEIDRLNSALKDLKDQHSYEIEQLINQNLKNLQQSS